MWKMEGELSRKGSFQELDEEERRSLFLRKTSTAAGISGLRRLRKSKAGLGAFSELSLSRSSFRLEQDDDRYVWKPTFFCSLFFSS